MEMLTQFSRNCIYSECDGYNDRYFDIEREVAFANKIEIDLGGTNG